MNPNNIAKFLSEFDHTYMDRLRPKGPDYLIIDTFVDNFEILEQDDLIKARNEAQSLTKKQCDEEKDSEYDRCDNLAWVKNLIDNGDKMPALSNIA